LRRWHDHPPFTTVTTVAASLRRRGNSQSFIRAVDRKRLFVGGHGSARDHRGFFRDEAVVLDDLTQFGQRHGVAWLEIQDRQPIVQAHFHLRDRRHFLDRHAHGVGTDLSIHPECLDLDVPQLRSRRCRRDQH